MTKAEQAAKMRDEGKSIDEIAKHFGWTIADAYSRVWRGRNADLIRQRENARNATATAREAHRKWRRKYGIQPREITYIENADKLQARNKRILDAVKAGATYSEAAEPEGVSRNAVAGLCHRNGVKENWTPEKQRRVNEKRAVRRWKRTEEFNRARVQRIRELREQGYLLHEIAELYGKSTASVAHMCQSNGIVSVNTPAAIARISEIRSQAAFTSWADPVIRAKRIAAKRKSKSRECA
jgi:transposase